MPGATTFPGSMGRGASWDADLEERIGDVIGRELRALGGNHFGGVCINLVRHPAWGRAQESYGERTRATSVPSVRRSRAVCSAMCWPVPSTTPSTRWRTPASRWMSPLTRALHEVYLPHFKRAVDAGVASVMSAYNSVNGAWCGQNTTLHTDILK